MASLAGEAAGNLMADGRVRQRLSNGGATAEAVAKPRGGLSTRIYGLGW